MLPAIRVFKIDKQAVELSHLKLACNPMGVRVSNVDQMVCNSNTR